MEWTYTSYFDKVWIDNDYRMTCILDPGDRDNDDLIELGDDFILEVSTPGIDRRFFYYEQLKEYVGEEFKIKLREPLDGIKNINGHLAECKDDFLRIETSNLEYKLEFSEIEFCKLEPNFEKIMKESEHAK